MARWLFKTEPTAYSFERLVKEKRARWDGIANPAALKNLRAVRKGDEILIYHTGNVKACVGIARASTDAAPDPDIEPVAPLAKPVTLAAVKAQARFKNFALVRQGRLSVMAVPDDIWQALLDLAR